MSREPRQDGWLGTTLRHVPAAATDACLDAETLAAWADGGLSAQAASAAELHASNCARCLAVLTAMERSAPAAPAAHAWTRARLFRWLVPLTAAATAIAIWVAVPDRPVTPERSAMVDRTAANERADVVLPQEPARAPVQQAPVVEQVPVPAPEQRALEQRMRSQNAAPGAKSEAPAAAREELQKAQLPSAAPVQALPPAAAPAPQPETAADAIAGTATARALSTKDFSAALPRESMAPANAQVRWRVVGSTSVERSTDGGKTWASARGVPGVEPGNPALTIVGIRAVDADRAVVRTSDSRELYTTNGGLSWTRVQENSTAPF